MKVLYISSKPAYPKNDGGTFAVAAFLDTMIAANFEVTYFTLATEKHPIDHSAFPEHVRERIHLESSIVDTSVRPLNAFLHLFKPGSFNVDRFYSTDTKEKILELLREELYEIIILDSLFATPYIAEIRSHTRGRIFIRTHNVESDLWHSYAQNAHGLKAIYLRKLARDIKKYEVSVLRYCDGILSISDNDRTRFKEMGINTISSTLPVTLCGQKPAMNYDRNTVYHFGSMNWEPNRESVNQLLAIWKKVLVKNPTAQCVIAGSDATKFYSSDKSKNIEVIGFVDDPVQFSQEMGILVAPISTASGIRIKILEAMNAGIPIVTTTIGALGIDHESNNCLVIADNKETLVEKIVELIQNKALREEIGTNGRDYLVKNHNIADTSQKLIEFVRATQ